MRSMPKRYAGKSCAVLDSGGLFVSIAEALAKDFDRVSYYRHSRSSDVTTSEATVGKGLAGVTRVDDYHRLIGETDLWVFPDVYMGAAQLDLTERGESVWGARMAEELELDRIACRKHVDKLGISIGPWAVVTGITELRAYLKAHDDMWVKFSPRGDRETFSSKSYRLTEGVVDELSLTLGPERETKRFSVEAHIPDAIEIAYDGPTVDGQWPSVAVCGVEVKNKAYIGKVLDYEDFPDALREINDKLTPTLKRYQYRSWWAAETMKTKDGYYFSDPCCRMGSPGAELWPLLYSNFPVILYEGARGKMIEPDPNATWAVELVLSSGWARKHATPIFVPEEIADNVTFRNYRRKDGIVYALPQSHEDDIIANVVAIGDDLDETIAQAKEYAGQVEAFEIDFSEYDLDRAKQRMDELKDFGITL